MEFGTTILPSVSGTHSSISELMIQCVAISQDISAALKRVESSERITLMMSTSQKFSNLSLNSQGKGSLASKYSYVRDRCPTSKHPRNKFERTNQLAGVADNLLSLHGAHSDRVDRNISFNTLDV